MRTINMPSIHSSNLDNTQGREEIEMGKGQGEGTWLYKSCSEDLRENGLYLDYRMILLLRLLEWQRGNSRVLCIT